MIGNKAAAGLVLGGAVWFLLCLDRVNARSAEVVGTSRHTGIVHALGGASTGAKEERARLEEARLSHVRHVLDKRLGSVISGSRSRQFERWASKGGDLKVISMHGVDGAELDFVKGDDTISVASSDGLYPDDAINLELVPVEGMPSLYPGKPVHGIEDSGVSVFDLFFRSIRLGFNFAPVASTAWLAMLSTTFREKVWFKWVATCLSISGPAFIKWGKFLCLLRRTSSCQMCHNVQNGLSSCTLGTDVPNTFMFYQVNGHPQDQICSRTRYANLSLSYTTMHQAILGNIPRK